jgi:large subunit ribosomal protein L10
VDLAISKERKEELVAQYQQKMRDSKGYILTEFSGLSVREFETLRGDIDELGGSFLVVKNTLAELAFKEEKVPYPDDAFLGTTAIGFAVEDIPGVAKVILDLANESESVRIKCGVVEGTLYDSEKMEQLANLPPLPVVRAQLLGLISTPANQLAGVVASSVRQVINVMNAYAESESTTSEA